MTHNRTKRRTFTSLQRAELFRTHNGICHICKRPIQVPHEKWEIEHVIARELFADPLDADNDENLRPAHVDCHKDKTKTDKKAIAKSNRIYAKNIGAHRPSATKIKSPGFAKSTVRFSAARGRMRSLITNDEDES